MVATRQRLIDQVHALLQKKELLGRGPGISADAGHAGFNSRQSMSSDSELNMHE